MITTAWRWLALLAIPGCLLVQPLDDLKTDGSAGSSGKPSNAGSAGKPAGGSGPGASGGGGSGNQAGSSPQGGANNGGATGGPDLSLFTGEWVVTGGKITTSCDDKPATTSDVTPGDTDKVGPGTASDLIFGPGSSCEILADVDALDDHTASLNDKTQDCVYSDGGLDFDQYILTFDFVVSDDGKTADATMSSSILVSDGQGGLSVCDADSTFTYKR